MNFLGTTGAGVDLTLVDPREEAGGLQRRLSTLKLPLDIYRRIEVGQTQDRDSTATKIVTAVRSVARRRGPPRRRPLDVLRPRVGAPDGTQKTAQDQYQDHHHNFHASSVA